MNLYITDYDLVKSAESLDYRRLKQQLIILIQIISNTVRRNPMYSEYWIYTIGHLDRRLMEDNNQHNALTEWANANVCNFQYILNYSCILYVVYYKAYLNLGVPILLNNIPLRFMAGDITEFNQKISRLTDNYIPLHIKNFEFYRNTKPQYDNISDIISAYRQQLIDLWKDEFNRYNIYKNKLAEWKALPTPLPPKYFRKANRPMWLVRDTNAFIPEFAKDELKPYFEVR